MTTNKSVSISDTIRKLQVEEATFVATRANLRLFPTIITGVCSGNHPLIMLATIRSLVVTYSESAGVTEIDEELLSTCTRDLSRAVVFFGENTPARLALLGCLEALEALQLTKLDPSRSLELAVASIQSSSRAAARLARSTTRHAELRECLRAEAVADALTIADADLGVLRGCPIWDTQPWPKELSSRWKKFSGTSYSHQETWKFWREWYVGHLDGTELPKNVFARIAAIEDQYWHAGPNEIARQILELQARLDVSRHVEDWAEKVRPHAVAGIGHNAPPEAIEDITETDTATTDIARELEEESAEIARLQKVVARLRAVATRLAEIAGKSAEKAAVSAGAVGISGTALLVWNKADALILAIEKWIAALTNIPI